VLVFVGGGIIAFLVFAVPAMRSAPPLTAEEREICLRLARQGKAFPFLCRHSVKEGACPCQPCQKLNDAKLGKL
jgi:hypothetical protein